MSVLGSAASAERGPCRQARWDRGGEGGLNVLSRAFLIPEH